MYLHTCLNIYIFFFTSFNNTVMLIYLLCSIQGSQMEEEIRQLERKLKQALSEQEHLREHNTYLTSELDRFVHTCIHFIFPTNPKIWRNPYTLKCLATYENYV